MKNIHIIPAEKFTKNFINNTNSNFDEKNNFFCVVKHAGYNNLGLPDDIHNVKFVNMKSDYLNIFFTALKFDKIIIHNLSCAHPILLFLLSLLPKKIKKQYWVMWGQDLYCYENKKTGIKDRSSEFFRKLYIRNLFGIIFWVKGDWELACKWYKTKAKYFMGGYSSNNLKIIKEVLNSKKLNELNNDDYIRVQLGNSAAIRNNHISALEKLKKIDTKKLLIYVPLSYAGSQDYIDSVISKGRELFEDRFIPLKTMMSMEDYVNYLNTIDVGIFNTDRQMGLGNISILLALGKKVFINDFTTSWDFYYDRGIKIFPFNKIDFSDKDALETLFSPLTEQEQIKNFKCIENQKATFEECWRNIYNS